MAPDIRSNRIFNELDMSVINKQRVKKLIKAKKSHKSSVNIELLVGILIYTLLFKYFLLSLNLFVFVI